MGILWPPVPVRHSGKVYYLPAYLDAVWMKDMTDECTLDWIKIHKTSILSAFAEDHMLVIFGICLMMVFIAVSLFIF